MKMSKKIGIITFHFADNYGAVFQCVALQKFLENIGHQVEVINYIPEYHTKSYRVVKTPRMLYQISIKEGNSCFKAVLHSVTNLKKNIHVYKLYHKKKNFRKYRDKYMNLTTPLYTIEDFTKIEKRYNAIILGSDQIWNKNITNGKFDEVYFGYGFSQETRKISYAASVGNLIDEGDLPQFKKLLCNLSSVLVREKQLENQIVEQINLKSNTVLDPVFLLAKEEWMEFCKQGEGQRMKRPYLFVYRVLPDKKFYEAAKLLAEKKGLMIVEANLKCTIGGVADATAGPDDFLSLMYNAELIVTNSFHATALSIILEKEFYTHLPPNRASRLENLLGMLELTDRELNDDKLLNLTNEKIEYSNVYQKLEIFKKESVAYLKESLS